MAASINVLGNIRQRTVNLFYRSQNFSALHGRKCSVGVPFPRRAISHNANDDSADAKPVNDDFFGIPEDFKLQHARFRSTHKTKSTGEALSIPTSHPTTQPLKDNRRSSMRSIELKSDNALSRKERYKKIRPTAFNTTFGTISFDQNEETSLDKLEMKAQEILSHHDTYNAYVSSPTKLNYVNYDSEHSGETVKSKHPFGVNEGTAGNDKKDLENAMPASARNPSSTDVDEKSNIFDETFFPELTISRHEKECPSLDTTVEKVTVGKSLGKENESFSAKSQPPAHFENVIGDEHYFGVTQNNGRKPELSMSTSLPENTDSVQNQSPRFSYFDEQYFGTHRTNSDNNNNCKTDTEYGASTITHVEDFNEVDRQYFEDSYQYLSVSQENSSWKKGSLQSATQGNLSHFNNVVKKWTSQSELRYRGRSTAVMSETGKSTKSVIQVDTLPKTLRDQVAGRKENENDNEDVEELLEDEEQNVQQHTSSTETAYDLAMKIRQDMKYGTQASEKPSQIQEALRITGSKGKDEETKPDSATRRLDSKSYRILDNQVQNLDHMTSADILRMLKSRIIFDHEDFLAIDKPYGLPSHGQKHDRVSVSELLPSLSTILPKSFGVSELHLIQGMDRDVTGAVILAKNPEVASIIGEMYNDHEKVIQRYWALTKGIPNPSAGVIDIPIGEAKVGNIYKMILRPRYYKDEKLVGKASKAPSKRAITEYNVLTSHLQSALVECTLKTSNVRHQLRVHLASGLNTPILGDHKYSNFTKLAPQKLHREMLELLKIRQAKARHLALHLHCRSVVLTDYKGRMIFLTTRPPSHFKENMKSLKLYIPKK